MPALRENATFVKGFDTFKDLGLGTVEKVLEFAATPNLLEQTEAAALKRTERYVTTHLPGQVQMADLQRRSRGLIVAEHAARVRKEADSAPPAGTSAGASTAALAGAPAASAGAPTPADAALEPHADQTAAGRVGSVAEA